MIMHQLDARMGKMLEDLKGMLVRRRMDVDGILTGPRGAAETPFANGGVWGRGEWEDFKLSLDVPAEGNWYLYATTGREGAWDAINPQFVVRVNGQVKQAFDVNHIRLPLENGAHEEILLQGYCQPSATGLDYPYLKLELCDVDAELEQLIYDLKVPYEAVMLMPSDNREREVTLETLSRALDLLDLRNPHDASFNETVREAREYLKKNYYEPRKAIPPMAVAECVGHTHIDVAWLWDLHQTRSKAVRSFSTVLSLMDRYPEYRFMSSQPALYDFVKQDEPELYERIRRRVAEGRWEVEGGMWVEADCNLSGGESLARQFLYGQRFFEKEFGKRCRVLWLPDVFGYSAALPQLMKLSGIDYFMTTKLSWSEYNLTPYDTFMWKGIDGTKVLTHFSPSREYYEAGHGEGHEGLTHYTTYNALIQPSQIAGGWKRFQQKGIDDHFLVSYGYGDGGGGPTDWMLEQGRRMETPMPNTPVVRQTQARPFFEALEKRVAVDPRLPVWSGELYLEYHRGTYTAQAHNKRNNRKIELALRSAELRFLEAAKYGMAYPAEALAAIWKDVLTLQFHDILPGSSIRKVYEDSDKMYAACFEKLGALCREALEKMLEKDDRAVTVLNDLDFVRSDVVRIPAQGRSVSALAAADGSLVPVQRVGDEYVAFVKNLTPMGATTFTVSDEELAADTVRVTREYFETPFFSGRFDESMRIVSLIDKRVNRELCRPGEKLNRIVCYENRPHNYDAWDVNIYYNRRSWEVDQVADVEIVSEGPVCAVLRVKYAYSASTIEQELRFYRDLPRIDFNTRVNWNEEHYLLKAHFPVDVFYNDATFDVQYGNVRRATHKNTSWDAARFEVCAHKWMDVSEPDYGVALLNDCKYGHSVDENGLALTLLKSSTYPDPKADRGEHEFSYALLPHVGDWREGGVVDAAYAFNCPAEAIPGMRARDAGAFVRLEGEGAVVESVKKAEDGDDVIVRLYECYGRRANVKLIPGFPFAQVHVCNILEENGEAAAVENGAIALSLKPYQIVTLRFSK